MRFRYKAATPDGSVSNGVLVGESREHIVGQLRALNQIPIRVDEAKPEKQARAFNLQLARR